jgi:hypothetical protein
MNWELIVEHKSGAMENSTYRLKIPEGWLYRYGSQLVFVPVSSAPPVFAPQPPSWNHVANAYGAVNAKDQ